MQHDNLKGVPQERSLRVSLSQTVQTVTYGCSTSSIFGGNCGFRKGFREKVAISAGIVAVGQRVGTAAYRNAEMAPRAGLTALSVHRAARSPDGVPCPTRRHLTPPPRT